MEDEEVDLNLKVISPSTDAKSVRDDGGIKTATNLVKTNLLLFERARDMVGRCDPYVEVKFGRLKGTLCLRSSSVLEIFALEKIGIGTCSVWYLNLAAASIGIYNVANTLSRVYPMPGTCCLRVNLIQASGLVLQDRTESSQIFIRATLENLTFTSNLVNNTKWNEDILIAVAEKFDLVLILNMEQGSHNRVDGSSASTKTIVSLNGGYHEFDEDPRWNEQYSWDVYDSCTFITNCVFDIGQLHEGDVVAIGAIDTRIGKMRINRIYSYAYPLQPLGLKNMGEIQLAFKFCKVYTLPMLPRQRFANSLSPTEVHRLRKQVAMLVSSREVVEYMLDSGEITWSMQRGRADFERINTLSGLVALYPQVDEICKWKSPISTLIICLVLLLVIAYPQYLLLPIFSCHFLHVLLQHQNNPRKPLQLSHVHPASVVELEGIMRSIYDGLRVAAGKYVTLLGDFATRGERLQSLLIWQDPIATMLVMVLCLITGILTFIVPFQDIVSVWLLYLLRHPILRSSVPTLHENRTRSMPTKLEGMIYRVNSICIDSLKSFYIIIQSQIVMYSKFVDFYNNYLKSYTYKYF